MTIAEPPSRADTLLARMLRVAAHIDAHLDDDLDFTRLADIACLSPHHFHRVYVAVNRETVAETVRRRRLERAAVALVQSGAPVARLAREAGYGSTAAFTRAFATRYGAPPAAFRRAKSRPAPFVPREEIVAMLDVAIETLPDLRVAALTNVGPYDRMEETFDRAGPIAARQNLFTPDTISAVVYFDDPETTPVEILTCECGFVVADGVEVAPPLKVVSVPGGRVARLRHVGPYAALPGLWADFWKGWLPTSGHVPRDAPTLELYRNDPRSTAPTDLVTDLFIAIE